MNVRRMPDFVGTAQNMSEFFGPDDCQPNEILIRRGMMSTKSGGPRDCVMCYCADIGFNSLRVIVKYDDGWEAVMGSSNCHADIIRAMSDVIQCGCP